MSFFVNRKLVVMNPSTAEEQAHIDATVKEALRLEAETTKTALERTKERLIKTGSLSPTAQGLPKNETDVKKIVNQYEKTQLQMIQKTIDSF